MILSNVKINSIIVGDERYLVRSILKESYKYLVEEWRNISPQHKVFFKKGELFFCELIEEAQIINENLIKEEQNDKSSVGFNPSKKGRKRRKNDQQPILPS